MICLGRILTGVLFGHQCPMRLEQQRTNCGVYRFSKTLPEGDFSVLYELKLCFSLLKSLIVQVENYLLLLKYIFIGFLISNTVLINSRRHTLNVCITKTTLSHPASPRRFCRQTLWSILTPSDDKIVSLALIISNFPFHFISRSSF